MSYNDAILQEAGPSSQTITPTEAAFVKGFRRYGGVLNSKCRFAHYETMGTGLVAAETIEEGEALFSIPRDMLLNLKNSSLPEICTQYEKQRGITRSSSCWENVNTGWLGLILTVMYEQYRSSPIGKRRLHSFKNSALSIQADIEMSKEEADEVTSAESPERPAGQNSRNGGLLIGKVDWGFYLDILPKTFDTPMFWSEEDLIDLKGTSIPGKIGREEASKDYQEKVRPFILSRPEIFFGTLIEYESIDKLIEDHYSMQCFHMMGSRILSRSFHVKDADEGVLGEEGKEHDGQETQSDVDSNSDDDEEGEEDEDINTVSMVPMADMLNARNGCDNAHLFYMPNELEMRATQRIPAGAQIMNTYGDPPSSDLLRRYGYVDLGNPADVVEIGIADLVEACLKLESNQEDSRRKSLLDRFAWSCSLGLDEVFVLSYLFPPSDQAPHRPVPSNPSTKEFKEAAMTLPEEMLIQARLLCYSDETFEKAKLKEKLPNPKFDATEEHNSGTKSKLSVAELIHQAIEVRKKAYTTSLEEDEELLYRASAATQYISMNKRNAIVVRLGEKRILSETQKVLQAALSYVETKRKDAVHQNGAHVNKRKKV